MDLTNDWGQWRPFPPTHSPRRLASGTDDDAGDDDNGDDNDDDDDRLEWSYHKEVKGNAKDWGPVSDMLMVCLKSTASIRCELRGTTAIEYIHV